MRTILPRAMFGILGGWVVLLACVGLAIFLLTGLGRLWTQAAHRPFEPARFFRAHASEGTIVSTTEARTKIRVRSSRKITVYVA